jgi:TRAP-type C4-dicarboxylate transport system substrate-binding protein
MYYILTICLVLSTGLFGSTIYFGNTLLKRQSQKLNEVKVKERVLEQQQISLAQAKKDIEQYKDIEATLPLIVPQDKNQAKAVREITKIAEKNNIKIQSITFPSSNLGTQPAVVAPSSDGSTDATTTPVPVPTITQVRPVANLPGLFEMEITIVSEPTIPNGYDDLIDFFEDLERNRRTAQVTNLEISTAATGSEKLDFTAKFNIFIKP